MPSSTPIPNGPPPFLSNGLTQAPTDDTKRSGSKAKRCLIQNLLTLLTFGAVLLGVGLGFLLRGYGPWDKRTLMYIEFPGELFLRMLKGLILPLIVASLISAVGGLDTTISGKIGLRAVAYYMITTVMAIVLGIILVVSIRPGSAETSALPEETNKKIRISTTADTLMDLVRNMFPPNLVEAAFAQFATVLTPPKMKNESENVSTNYNEWTIGNEYGGGTNILGLVVFSVVLGVVLGQMKEQGRPLLAMCTSLSEAMMRITKLVIWLSPVGVIFLIMAKIMEIERLDQIAGQVGMYTVTVMVGLFIHGLLVLPVIYFIFVRRLPFSYLSGLMQALATAFATSSSSATLPVTISCLEEKNGVDPRVTRFCLPIGATINMDGTALYEAVAAIFISQVRHVPLDAGKIVAISITATAASIGAAGIPQAGLVTMVMVLNVIGLPPEDVALILIVDWFLDRFRTAINVLGDAVGAAVVEHLSREDLQAMDKTDEKQSIDSLAKPNLSEVTSM